MKFKKNITNNNLVPRAGKSIIDITEKIIGKNIIIATNNKISDDPNRVIEFEDDIQAWIDNDTGLMWEIKTKESLQYLYVWNQENYRSKEFLERYDSQVETIIDASAVDIFSYTKKLNNIKYAGYNDWRVPTIDELFTILTHEKINDSCLKPPLSKNNTIHTMKNLFFWSSSSVADKHTNVGTNWNVFFEKRYAWSIDVTSNFTDSCYGYSDKNSLKYIRCVRGINKTTNKIKPMDLTQYENHNIKALQLELKEFEERLQELNEKRDEYIHSMDEFNTEHKLKLGSLIEKISILKEQILKENILKKEKLQDDNIKREYEEYQEFIKAHTKFKEDYNRVISIERKQLSVDEKKEIKKLFRRSVKLCHPDITIDKHKKQAHNIMQELNDAYSRKDISKIKEILFSLENGMSFETESDVIDDEEILKLKILDIKKNINNVISEINDLKNDETYSLIKDLNNWDEYFIGIEELLNKEYADLLNN